MKKQLLALAAVLSLSDLFPSRGDSAFGGFMGGLGGSMIGGAIAGSGRKETVVIREAAPVSAMPVQQMPAYQPGMSQTEMERMMSEMRGMRDEMLQMQKRYRDLDDENYRLKRELEEAKSQKTDKKAWW